LPTLATEDDFAPMLDTQLPAHLTEILTECLKCSLRTFSVRYCRTLRQRWCDARPVGQRVTLRSFSGGLAGSQARACGQHSQRNNTVLVHNFCGTCERTSRDRPALVRAGLSAAALKQANRWRAISCLEAAQWKWGNLHRDRLRACSNTDLLYQ
jgi:hypothetical protein